MAVNKIVYAGNSLIDLTSDTVTASDLLQGVVAHDKAGNTITGTLTVPEQQEKTVDDLFLVRGNQTIVPDVGKTLSKVIINKPDTLIAENVKKDVTIAGVVGTLEPTLQKKTVTPSTSEQTITPDTDYDGLSQVTIEAIPTVTQATPSITVDSTGLITASTTQSEGYVTSGTKSVTRQLTKQLGKTVTPGTSDVVAVESGKYTTGTVYVKGDSNLTASNIKSGTTIFGITGSYAGSSPKLQSKSVTYTSNGTATITPDEGYDGLSSVDVTVNVSGGGGSGASAKLDDVTFIDYDGSVLYSYSLAEAQSLTELPELPAHDGLVCQGWNWTLEAIKALNRPVTVGAMYITDDGATRLHIRIATIGRMTVPLYIGQTVANGVSIDWGDGRTTQTLSGTGNVNTSHTYAEPGDYIISLIPKDGCKLSFGNMISSHCVMGSTGNNGKVYCNMLQEFYVGKNVTSIGNYAFQNCHSLANITIPTGVTSIGNYAFQNCNSLANITIPTGVTSISNYAFQNCYSLASITIPTGVTSIGNYAFIYCHSLTSITIPTGVTSIGDSAFYNCNSLANITIPTGVTSISNYAFHNCNSLANITIPTGVTSIGDSAFAYCYSLANITIPTGVTSIGNYAFQNCNSLANITIPTGVTSISNYAFQNCYSLASITIPTGVTSIGNYAFHNCHGMRYYDFSACTAIPALSNKHVFYNIPSDCQMLIPSALYNNWKTATNWTTYASKMVSV